MILGERQQGWPWAAKGALLDIEGLFSTLHKSNYIIRKSNMAVQLVFFDCKGSLLRIESLAVIRQISYTKAQIQ